MKKYILLSAFITVTAMSFGQRTGKNQLNFGVGLSDWGIPVYLGIDGYIHRDVTLGGELSYRYYHQNVNDIYYDNSILGISGNVNYHFNRILNINPHWDLYAGLNAGFYIWNSPDNYNGSGTSGLGLGAQIGTRYYLSKNVGINLEFGGGSAFTNGKLGLTVTL